LESDARTTSSGSDLTRTTTTCCGNCEREKGRKPLENAHHRPQAPVGNAVKHFRSRIRENSGGSGGNPKSHDFGYHRSPGVSRAKKCFTALPAGAARAYGPVPVAPPGLGCLLSRYPGANAPGYNLSSLRD
jgi:hypothetical protein